MEEDPARPRLPAITSRQTLLLGLQDKVIKNFKGVVQNFKASRYSWKIMNACMPDLHTPSCRLVYFGGYGHKLLTDVDSRNRSFIVDEASWVICRWCYNIHHLSLKFLPFDYLTLSPGWRCVLGMEQWGSCIWPNELQLEWTKNKCKPQNILWNGNDYLMDGCEVAFFFSKILGGFYSGGLCVQGRAPAPRAAHASATLGHRGYICGGRVMVSIIYGHFCIWKQN